MISHAMLQCAEAAVTVLPPGQEFDHTIVHALEKLTKQIVSLWGEAIFHAQRGVGILEEQLERNFNEKPQDPASILHEAQRLARRLTGYCNQVTSMQKSLTYSMRDERSTSVMVNLGDVKARLETLIKRTDNAVPALLGEISISEASKAASLTAIAVWFAPLSLSVSIVSIDGDSRFGGKKYWIWACIAVPLLLVAILVANAPDKLIRILRRKKRKLAYGTLGGYSATGVAE